MMNSCIVIELRKLRILSSVVGPVDLLETFHQGVEPNK